MANNFTLFSFSPSSGNLEQLFMEITEVNGNADAKN
jgi:hypothetical protein